MRIPREHHQEILTRAGRGESAATIAKWLATLGTEVSDRAIRGLLQKTRQERGDAAKVKVRETLAPVITNDLAELEKVRRRLRRYERAAAEVKEFDTAIRAAKEQAAVLDKKLHYSGADSPDKDESAPVAAAVIVLPPVTDE